MHPQIRPKAVGVLRALGLNRLAGKLYYKFLHGFGPAGSALPSAVERCMQMAEQRGLTKNSDYCEFGIFKGYTFQHAQKVAGSLGIESMRFIGFDSFEGLPELSNGDVASDGQKPFYAGQYACSLESVKRELNNHGVDWTKTFLVNGYFNDSLISEATANLDIKRIAIALVDCDLYSSTVDVLNFIDTRLLDGAIVIMDDWKSYGPEAQDGQPRALREFLERSPHWECRKLFDYGSYSRVFEFIRISSSTNASDDLHGDSVHA